MPLVRHGPARAWLALALLAALAACRVEPTERPSPPTLDGVPARSSHATLTITGAAEPGALVAVLRTPAFAPDYAPPVTHADPSTARWSMTLPLAAGRVNTFSFTAVNIAGLASDPVTVDVRHSAASETGLSVLLEQPRVALDADGEAALRVRAKVRVAEGADASGRTVVLHVADYPQALADVVATTDADGVAYASFSGLTRVGAGRLEASIEESALPPDTAAFEIVAGEPASASLVLSATSPEGEPVTGRDVTIAAGAEVRVQLVAKDAGGNAVQPSWTVSTAPSDTWIAGSVVRFTRAGTYELTGVAFRGDDVPPPKATANVTVVPATGGAQDGLRLSVAMPREARSGEPFVFEAALTDAFANAVTPFTLTAQLSDAGGQFEAVQRRITLSKAGDTTITLRATRGADVLAATDPIHVRVRPGAPASLALSFGGEPAPLSAPRQVGPGAELALTAIVKDAAANVLADVPLAISADPGVVVFGATVLAPTAPGTYAVNALVPGTTLRALAAIAVQPSPPARLVASCPSTADAGIAFECSARVEDSFGRALAVPVVWTASPAGGAAVSGPRITLQAAGAVQLSASANGLEPVVRDVTVRPGPATTLRLTLAPASVKVGGAVAATYSAVDAFLNVVPLPVALTTDAPGALASGVGVSNFQRAGTYRVFANTVAGAGIPALAASAQVVVTAEAAASVTLALSADRTDTGAPVRVTTTAADPFGNPVSATPAITIDGRAPDGVLASLSNGQLSVFRAGTYRIAATLGDATDTRLLDVREAADALAPQVSVWLDLATAGGAAPLYKPGAEVRVTVRAHDDRGVAGVRVRASGPELGTLYDESVALEEHRTEHEAVYRFTLPAERIGGLTVVAAATDRAGNAASATPVPATSDFHFDRLAFGSGLAAAVARSVSIDSVLEVPAALAFSGTSLHVLNAKASGGTGSTVVRIGPAGAVQGAWTLGDVVDACGLAALPSGTDTFFFTAGTRTTGNPLLALRLSPSQPAAQTYTTPPLDSTSGSLMGGVAVDHRSATKLLYVAEERTSGKLGRIWSMPAKTAAVASVDASLTGGSKEVYGLELNDHRVQHVCLQDAANPGKLYFTGVREGGSSTLYSGVYRITLSASGHVPASATPEAVFEQRRNPDSATTSVVYGPCLFVAGASAADHRLVFTRWEESPAGAAVGRVTSVTTECADACQARNLVTGTAGARLGAMAGLARGVSGAAGGTGALYVSESLDGRIFRVENLF